jgi:hypothetical protein
MARLIVVSIAFFSALHPIAVEYDLDRPLESPASWRYYQGSHFYAQHRCGDAQLQAIGRRIQRFLEAPEKQRSAELGPVLQVRLYASAADYRKNLKFSKYRDGHFNRRLGIIVSYCDVPAQRLAEQMTLFALADKPLRKWQRVFLAEILPVLAGRHLQNAFGDVGKDKPAALLPVLYSNHWPGRSERATLRLLATHLADRQLLEPFVERLLEASGADDTGRELLESLTTGDIGQLADSIAGTAVPNGNKTLRKGQTK